MAQKAQEFRYAIGLDRTGRLTAEGTSPLELADAWKPEHLLLAGLVRCTLQSLRFHAERDGVDFLARASAAGTVTRRAEDGRYAFVEINVELDLELEPPPARDEVRALLDRAERDCFVGASLQPAPQYRWRMNGSTV